MKKMFMVKNRVLKFLEEDEQYRKDDLLLIKTVYSDILNKDVTKMQFTTICSLILNGKLPPFDSIRRARNKIEKERPDLIHKPTQLKRRGNMKDYIEFAKS